MPHHDYPWPRYLTGPEDHLSALGVISLNFNLYEHSLAVFLEEHLSKEVAAYLSDRLTNEQRSHLIRLLMKTDPEPQVYAEVEFVLRHFATCAENRHNLLHSRPAFGLGLFGADNLSLEKLARGNPEKLLAFELEIGDLHRTADEMRAGYDFVVSLWRYFREREKWPASANRDAPPREPPPSLPERPPEPRKINPSPGPEARPNG
jgi:hypothetical protein